MTKPLPPIKMKQDKNKKTAVLLEDYSVLGVTIPKGFRTDGVTIPRGLWWWMPPWAGQGILPALLHDYLRWRISEGKPHPLATTWKQADRMFYECLLLCGVSKFKAGMLWTGVEAFSFAKTHTGQDKFTPSK